MAENGLSAIVCPNGVFSQNRTRICGIAENGNREWETGLHLIDGGELPVPADCLHPPHSLQSRNLVNGTERKTVPYVAGRSLLSRQVVVVLRNRGLEHG